MRWTAIMRGVSPDMIVANNPHNEVRGVSPDILTTRLISGLRPFTGCYHAGTLRRLRGYAPLLDVVAQGSVIAPIRVFF